MSGELRRVLQVIEGHVRSGTLPLVVFDLDSTLFATADRNLRILSEFAAEHTAAFPGLGTQVAALSPQDMGWNVLDPLKERGYAPEGLKDRFIPYWVERFFTDEYVKEDPPNPGAVAFVNACHASGALIYYLTGRHKGGMEHGTVHSLSSHGFPYWRGRAVLHLKPSFDMDDFAYKTEALADIRSYLAPVVATFENEPGNANLFLDAFPEGTHFLLQTEHHPGAPAPSERLVQIPDFSL